MSTFVATLLLLACGCSSQPDPPFKFEVNQVLSSGQMQPVYSATFASYSEGMDGDAVSLELQDDGVEGVATVSVGKCAQFSCVGPVEVERLILDITPPLGDVNVGFGCIGLDGYVNGGLDLDYGGGCAGLEAE